MEFMVKQRKTMLERLQARRVRLDRYIEAFELLELLNSQHIMGYTEKQMKETWRRLDRFLNDN